jgi:hypothetical protein
MMRCAISVFVCVMNPHHVISVCEIRSCVCEIMTGDAHGVGQLVIIVGTNGLIRSLSSHDNEDS